MAVLIPTVPRVYPPGRRDPLWAKAAAVLDSNNIRAMNKEV
jgi:hypothetical protein